MSMNRATRPSSLGLRQLDLLQGLPPERLEAIANACTWRHCEPGRQLVAREDDDRHVHFIVAGSVRVTTYSSGGRETSFRDLAAGTSFGELSALDGRPRSADVVALTSGLIASLPPEAFLSLLRTEWSVTERVLLRLTDTVRRLTDRVIDLSTLSVQQRVCAELLRMAQSSGATGSQARLDPAPKHAELAHQVSSYREQITRELSSLAKLGLVSRESGALVLLDVGRLKQLSQGLAPPA
jgi:CRP/FNR family transcriptional regulator, cyclic AMP receptor protein